MIETMERIRMDDREDEVVELMNHVEPHRMLLDWSMGVADMAEESEDFRRMFDSIGVSLPASAVNAGLAVFDRFRGRKIERRTA